MNPTSFEHIVRIQFNALMMTVIKCTVKNRNRQFARRSKREGCGICGRDSGGHSDRPDTDAALIGRKTCRERMRSGKAFIK